VSIVIDLTEQYFKTRVAFSPDTEVIIQSSHKDVNSFFVYPTHPYVISEKFPNLHLIPDPCIVDINGLKIGITSTDTIGHLAENELTMWV
jgi:DNA polymerase alpha subunit B